MWYLHIVTPEGADPWLFRGGFFVTGLATLAVIAAVTHRRAWAGPLLGNPVLLWIGTRSYGLYLYHWPIYQVIRGVAGIPLTVAEFVLAMAITLVDHRAVVPVHRDADPPGPGLGAGGGACRPAGPGAAPDHRRRAPRCLLRGRVGAWPPTWRPPS